MQAQRLQQLVAGLLLKAVRAALESVAVMVAAPRYRVVLVGLVARLAALAVALQSKAETPLRFREPMVAQ